MESKLNTLTRKIKKRYLEYISEQSYYKLTNKGIVSDENIKNKAGKKKKKLISIKTSKFDWRLNDIRIEKIISAPIWAC